MGSSRSSPLYSESDLSESASSSLSVEPIRTTKQSFDRKSDKRSVKSKDRETVSESLAVDFISTNAKFLRTPLLTALPLSEFTRVIYLLVYTRVSILPFIKVTRLWLN
ncbi:hypothetical protein PoB_004324900 [Plakobranchus ocellatus]|uniref:Uncharacterized protein n=1 Tax=Plakobranchus ocellatus TaxID=259542 RepID=A0AAV4B9D8_9GAST|nr:hypothetical protein PoB_004324900 [Plakobranchus ocellatus]